MPRNKLPRVKKHYSPTGRRNYGRPLKRLLDTWDRNGSTSVPIPWQIYDDDDEVLNTVFTCCYYCTLQLLNTVKNVRIRTSVYAGLSCNTNWIYFCHCK